MSGSTFSGEREEPYVESAACETEVITKEKNKAKERGKAEGSPTGVFGAELRGGGSSPEKW